jgi:hypothetical protein
MTDLHQFDDGAARPDDDFPPPTSELEIVLEELKGRPLSGNPEERIVTLQKRIAYLEDEGTRLDEPELLRRNSAELAEARLQLGEWKAQHEARN